MSDAQAIHEALRAASCTTTDEPWNLCSAEYRIRFEKAIETLDGFVSREDYEQLEHELEGVRKERNDMRNELTLRRQHEKELRAVLGDQYSAPELLASKVKERIYK